MRRIGRVSVSVAETLWIEPDATHVARRESAAAGFEVARPHFVEPGFRIIRPAGEQSAIANTRLRQTLTLAVEDSGRTKIGVGIAFNRGTRGVGHLPYSIQLIGVHEIVRVSAPIAEKFVRSRAVDV